MREASAFYEARRFSARSVNAVMTATYWEMGRRIVEFEQQGKPKAAYGERLIDQLARDLSRQFGRGFSRRNLFQIRLFYLAYQEKVQTVSAQLGPAMAMPAPDGKVQTLSAESGGAVLSRTFALPWSHYVRLLSVEKPEARAFYEAEALCGGWSVRQLDRQISTLFYERTALSRDKAAMLKKGGRANLAGTLSPEEEIKDPLVLEFLGLKDEYSESALEETLIRHLEQFLLEIGNDFAFVARQKRLRVGNEGIALMCSSFIDDFAVSSSSI
jgi:predicted nuclease of restriction endonuclease-like (RecB) superfamily